MDRDLINRCIKEAISKGTTRGYFRYKYILSKILNLNQNPSLLKNELEIMVREGLLTKPNDFDPEGYIVTEQWLHLFG